MAINLVYQVPAAGIAGVAEATGQGQYTQAQDRLALEQERLAQQGQQFDQKLALERQMAALQDLQQRRSLGQRGYEFDVSQQNAAQAQQNQMAMRGYEIDAQQQGYADMREADQSMLDQKLNAAEKVRLSERQFAIQDQFKERQFNTAIKSAENLEELWRKGSITAKQRDQGRAQWVEKFGETAGEYPFATPPAPEEMPEVDVQFAQRDAEINALLPEYARREGISKLFHKNDGGNVVQSVPQEVIVNFVQKAHAEENRMKLEEIRAETTLTGKLETQQFNMVQEAAENKVATQRGDAKYEQALDRYKAKLQEYIITQYTAWQNAQEESDATPDASLIRKWNENAQKVNAKPKRNAY